MNQIFSNNSSPFWQTELITLLSKKFGYSLPNYGTAQSQDFASAHLRSSIDVVLLQRRLMELTGFTIRVQLFTDEDRTHTSTDDNNKRIYFSNNQTRRMVYCSTLNCSDIQINVKEKKMCYLLLEE